MLAAVVLVAVVDDGASSVVDIEFDEAGVKLEVTALGSTSLLVGIVLEVLDIALVVEEEGAITIRVVLIPSTELELVNVIAELAGFIELVVLAGADKVKEVFGDVGANELEVVDIALLLVVEEAKLEVLDEVAATLIKELLVTA